MTPNETAGMLIRRWVGPMQMAAVSKKGLRGDIARAIRAAVKAEREACAKVADAAKSRAVEAVVDTCFEGMSFAARNAEQKQQAAIGSTAKDIAATIRARGKK